MQALKNRREYRLLYTIKAPIFLHFSALLDEYLLFVLVLPIVLTNMKRGRVRSKHLNLLLSSQDTELAAAAEKLAECQETIFLLGKQLKYLRPQTELIGSPYGERSQMGEGLMETEPEPEPSSMNLQDSDLAEMDTAASANVQKLGGESPIDLYSSPCSPSDTEGNHRQSSPISSKHPKHRPTKSTSSTSSSAPTPEKHSRGFTRFFSSKAKNGH